MGLFSKKQDEVFIFIANYDSMGEADKWDTAAKTDPNIPKRIAQASFQDMIKRFGKDNVHVILPSQWHKDIVPTNQPTELLNKLFEKGGVYIATNFKGFGPVISPVDDGFCASYATNSFFMILSAKRK